MNVLLPLKYSVLNARAIGQFIRFKRHILNWNWIYQCVDEFTLFSLSLSLPLFLSLSLFFLLSYPRFPFVCHAFDCTRIIGDKSNGMYVYVNVECRTKTHFSILKIMVLDNKWFSTNIWCTSIASGGKNHICEPSVLWKHLKWLQFHWQFQVAHPYESANRTIPIEEPTILLPCSTSIIPLLAVNSVRSCSSLYDFLSEIEEKTERLSLSLSFCLWVCVLIVFCCFSHRIGLIQCVHKMCSMRIRSSKRQMDSSSGKSAKTST